MLNTFRKEILTDLKEDKEGEEDDDEEKEKAEKKKTAESGAAPGEEGADFVQVCFEKTCTLLYFLRR
jgi:hypothetical protein